MPDGPLIVYVPGLKPKPEASLHHEQLERCLLEGIRRIDPAIASEIDRQDAFELISWTYDFYGEHRDIALDLDDIEAVLQKHEASEEDVLVATSARRRFAIWLFQVADALPFLIPGVATEEVQIHLRDFHRYVADRGGESEAAREKLKTCIRQATDAGRPVLLFAHSMGSVIAWDALWQLSHEESSSARVDLLLTTGSPLGQRIVQRHLFGRLEAGAKRYPTNIGHWTNIAAIGELTAVDRELADDFSPMIRLGLVPSIDDRDCFNYYHMDGALNVHVEYGYLINEVTARVIGDWWREKRPA
jgi:pimeloyl-ACP methyl ester carboxylesterase